MTYVYGDAAAFADEMLEGFLNVHAGRVVGVRGGVVRAQQTPESKVAVVVGGGSGHYPAFCGLVGAGLADAAVVGNVFTSPSTADAYSVGRAVAGSAGVLFITGNYAGDVMNFSRAMERLRSDGVDARALFTTDDLASSDVAARRRGVGGSLVVFKIAGAAAEAGCSIDEVETLARRANERTRTLGVAFRGCTMPGSDSPLFTVPDGVMSVGLGIHGEAGIHEAPVGSAAELAARLVRGVLTEFSPLDGKRITTVLNGLGSTKYEELFVLWRAIARLLADVGAHVVEPEVGEFVTSLDMAGCSLTLTQLDDDLERLWRAPADTPAYRKGTVAPTLGSPRVVQRRTVSPATDIDIPTGGYVASADSRRCARLVVEMLKAAASDIHRHADELGRLDAVAGDGDHGRGMVRGLDAACAAAEDAVARGAGAGAVISVAGAAWGARAGGTSGALWESALLAIGHALTGDDERTIRVRVPSAFSAALDEVCRLGESAVGDKTIIDALSPFVAALQTLTLAGNSLEDAWASAAAAAEVAADQTADMMPRVGRARPLAARSLGSPDPGAVSFALCVRAAAQPLQAWQPRPGSSSKSGMTVDGSSIQGGLAPEGVTGRDRNTCDEERAT